MAKKKKFKLYPSFKAELLNSPEAIEAIKRGKPVKIKLEKQEKLPPFKFDDIKWINWRDKS